MAGIAYKEDCEGVDWAEMHTTLLRDHFDNGRTPTQYRISFENSYAVVIAYAAGKIIGTARALSDGVCNAYIVDVWTYTPYRRQGIARHMLELLLAKLDGQHVCLFTEDAAPLYAKLGFEADETGMARVVGQWLQNSSRT